MKAVHSKTLQQRLILSGVAILCGPSSAVAASFDTRPPGQDHTDERTIPNVDERNSPTEPIAIDPLAAAAPPLRLTGAQRRALLRQQKPVAEQKQIERRKPQLRKNVPNSKNGMTSGTKTVGDVEEVEDVVAASSSAAEKDTATAAERLDIIDSLDKGVASEKSQEKPPVSNWERIRLANLKKQEEKERLEKEAIQAQIEKDHELHYRIFALKESRDQIDPLAPSNLLRTRKVSSPKDLNDLVEIGAFAPMSVAELRGHEFRQNGGNVAIVNGLTKVYRKEAAAIWKIPEDKVESWMIALFGSYSSAKHEAQAQYHAERSNDSQKLKEWPGMGFDGFTRRKMEENWSKYGPDGRVKRDQLGLDCGVIHFSGVGEVIVHKSALPLEKYLKDMWATKRFEHLHPLDGREAVADIRRTQGTGGLTRILSAIEKIANQKIEATTDSEGDFDYAFKLPYVAPIEGGVDCILPEPEIQAIMENNFILSLPAAFCHNNILPKERLRNNITKGSFNQFILGKISVENGIPYKPQNEIEDH